MERPTYEHLGRGYLRLEWRIVKRLARMAAFGEEVMGPCAGEIIAEDGLPGLRPPEADCGNLAGNHVVVRCRGVDPEVDVLLAHMMEGSVAAKRSRRVNS